MKKGVVLLLLLVACARPMPEPIDYSAAFDVQAGAIVHPKQELIDNHEARIKQLVITFVKNQNCDSVEGFIESLNKNKQISSGFMREMIEVQERIFNSKKEFVDEWLKLYEKGKDSIDARELQVAEDFMRKKIYPIKNMNMKIDIHSVEVLNGDDENVPVKILFTEVANLPDRKNRREAEEIYFVHDENGRLTVSDLSVDDALMSKISLKTFEFMMQKQVNEESEALDWFRRTVGLST